MSDDDTLEILTKSWHGIADDRRVRSRALVPALTILYHPDPRRVGERVLLHELATGLSAGVSRSEPDFSPPDEGQRRPLDDLYLSRKPIRLVHDATADRIRLIAAGSPTRLAADGVAIDDEYSVSLADVERGVVLELGRRIVLLLHSQTATALGEDDRFGLVGASDAMVRLRQEIRIVSDLDVPVLLRGETGTGKELVAKAIHEAGRRRDEPYVVLNIGAVPPSLAASELFGAARGAFTGADRKKTGFFERAHGGTLFLDEIGETPSELQVLLLRALENQEIQPVGSVETRSVDVRVIAATDADLEAASVEGRFRAPLHHRLAGYELNIPALRARRADVGRLLFHFLRQELERLGDSLETGSDEVPWPSAELVARLVRYDWPGNVRQLRNVARRLAIARQAGPDVDLEPVVDELLKDSPAPATESASPDVHAGAHGGAPAKAPDSASAKAPRKPAKSYRPPHEVSDDELVAALKANGWRLKPTASALGVSRGSLYVLIDRCPRIRRASELDREEIEAVRERHGGDLDAMAEALEVSRYGLQRRMRELVTGSESSAS